MLDRLEKSRLIERRPNPQDRRGTLIVLTEGAEQRLTDLFGPLREAGATLASSYSENELRTLSDFFEKIAVVWQEQREKLQRR
jgi:DNA-binding MarR family transcriptional regulator